MGNLWLSSYCRLQIPSFLTINCAGWGWCELEPNHKFSHPCLWSHSEKMVYVHSSAPTAAFISPCWWFIKRRLNVWKPSAFRDPNTIFRGNSLTSKCIDETMKLAGMHYLQVTLKPIIDEVRAHSKTMYSLLRDACTWSVLSLFHGAYA